MTSISGCMKVVASVVLDGGVLPAVRCSAPAVASRSLYFKEKGVVPSSHGIISCHAGETSHPGLLRPMCCSRMCCIK